MTRSFPPTWWKSMERDRGRTRIVSSMALLMIICIFAYNLRAPLLTVLGGILVTDDDLEEADLLFLLNGDLETRPFHLVTLYEQGLAPRVAIAEEKPSPPVEMGLAATETTIVLGMLEAEGVPQEAITVIPYGEGVTSTYEEAHALADYVATEPIDRIILVTSAFHTTRARWIVKRALKKANLEVQVQVSAAPHWSFDVTNWWQTEEGLVYFVKEYLKWGYYLVNYWRG